MESVQTDKVVTMRYTMQTRLRDGTVKVRPEEELSFIFGVDRQVASLERGLEGRREGDTVRVTIPAGEIYGEHDPTLIREIPKKGLIKQRLKEGQYYRQMKKGCLVSFRVLELRPDAVLADFNEPLAGISVSVDLKIRAIRDASKAEIEAAHETRVKKSIGCG